jgi:hypothetical protein
MPSLPIAISEGFKIKRGSPDNYPLRRKNFALSEYLNAPAALETAQPSNFDIGQLASTLFTSTEIKQTF